ncbi:MAG: DUF4954 family protein [Treponema sp.]|jgi:hypothetical protein|nr:DUF4954 family protein [Treponema sp.]
MKEITILKADNYGYNFIPAEYLPQGRDEYWLRNRQAREIFGIPEGAGPWRKLRSDELEVLIKNDNYCSAWDNFLVQDNFDPNLIRNSNFYGLVRLGVLRNVLLRHHDFCVPAGIRNSTVISCDIGGDVAIQDCSYISNYIIGNEVILSRLDEVQTTNHAKFGNGVLRDGEDEDLRIWIDVMNEAGGRSILPFADMISADAFLWAAYRDDTGLTAGLKRITQETYGGSRGSYGTIGSGAVVKSSRIIKDAAIGSCAYIKGANKLKNITVLSSEEEPSQIGEGVEMVNGIVGYGCHIFYGSKAVRFVMGRNCNLKYGARLIHSVLGDNSTVSCCEMLNNLIFPVHEQHHNNSFLIASLIQGMSNMAAGATVGSNHNSRANDGEMRAGRGFWPGLSVTLKHSSRFAGFVLIAKGNYPYELNIHLPFSLVNNNVQLNRLEVMPAYFWMYNLYALERNSWKSRSRDKRKVKIQHIETDYLAPDTAEEIIAALAYMDDCFKAAAFDPGPGAEPSALPSLWKQDDAEREMDDPEYDPPVSDEALPAPGIERHNRGAFILKPRRAYSAYREMLCYYAAKTLADHFLQHGEAGWDDLRAILKQSVEGEPSGRVSEWTNLGGQIVPAFRVEKLRKMIREGAVRDWDDIHAEYGRMAASYPRDKIRHAAHVLGRYGEGAITLESFIAELSVLVKTRQWISAQVYTSRAKDFYDPFRSITYRNREEMEQATGKAEDNSFIRMIREQGEVFESRIRALQERLEAGTTASQGNGNMRVE